MEQPQTSNFPTLESNLDQLAQELHQLANRIKQPDPQREDAPYERGQYLVASGRS